MIKNFYTTLLFSIFISMFIVNNCVAFSFASNKNAIKEVSLADILYYSGLLTTDSSEEKELKRKIIDKFADEYEDKTDIDITESIYDVLDDNDDVKNIEINKLNKDSNYTGYSLDYVYKGRKIELTFIVQDVSIFSTEAICIDDIYKVLRKVGPIYGIPKKDIIMMASLFIPALPD